MDRIVYMEQTLNLIAKKEGVESADKIVKTGVVKTVNEVNYVLIEETDGDKIH